MPFPPDLQQEVVEFDRVRSEIAMMVSAQTQCIIHRPARRFLGSAIHMSTIGSLAKTILTAVLIPVPHRLRKMNVAGFSLNRHGRSLPAI